MITCREEGTIPGLPHSPSSDGLWSWYYTPESGQQVVNVLQVVTVMVTRVRTKPVEGLRNFYSAED
jgi:hypothetical protein